MKNEKSERQFFDFDKKVNFPKNQKSRGCFTPIFFERGKNNGKMRKNLGKKFLSAKLNKKAPKTMMSIEIDVVWYKNLNFEILHHIIWHLMI